MIEIERKFRLSNKQREVIEARIQSQYGKINAVRQSDAVFLVGIDSFAQFKQGMPIMRLRARQLRHLSTG